ncbi:MAG: HipA domain-containing protein [Burkholderiales bacterium]|jgi:serine/threonine-protein kinase HipA
MLTASGGARPKLTVEHDGALWLAKFPSARDPRSEPSVPALECAVLDLAQHAGLTVPRHELVRVRDRDVLLIERFDRSPIVRSDGSPVEAAWARHRYASARTLLWSEPEGARYSATGSYPVLATQLARWSADAEADRLELFRRVAFNCLVSNTDDHDLNLGMVDAGGGFRLAPAFDLVPQPVTTGRQYLAMVIGADGAAATRANLLSSAPRFGLTADDAADRLDAMVAAVGHGWRACLSGRGISDVHLERLAPRFVPGHFL